MRQIKLALTFIALAIATVGCTEMKAPSKVSSFNPISKESEAREEISSILFDQRTYFIGNQSFTTSIKDLKMDDAEIKSPHYTYQIVPKLSEQKGVVITATSKRPELRSFTGVVFVVDVGKEKVTVSEICETTKPSKRAPAVPVAPRKLTEQIKCPSGSRSAMVVLALY